MKRLLFISLICVILSPLSSYAQSGIFESYVILDINGIGNQHYDLQATTGNPDYLTTDFGSFDATDTFILNGAENKTTRCDNIWIVDCELLYRIYPISTDPNTVPFISRGITYTSDDGSAGCVGTDQQQTWQVTNENIDVLSGLLSDTYYLEVLTLANYNNTGVIGNPATATFWASNGGVNYRNSFIVDLIDPLITCPANITVDTDAGNCSAVVTYSTPVGTDNNPGAITTQTAGLASGATFPVGTTTNTFLVTDAAGNTASCSCTITVNDNENPTISCPGNQTGNVNASCNFSIPDYSGLATTSDNCAVDTVTQVPAAGTNVSVGTTNIVLTVTDVNGNSANCNFDVVVSDIIPPTITCPGNQTGNVNASCNFSIPNYTGLATTGDNCAVDTVTQVPAAGTNVSVGTTNIVLTVTDVSGNSANCNFDVVVSDIIPPTITCLGNQTGNVNASCNFSIPNYTGLATTGDNCAVDTVTQVPSAGTNVSVGTTNIVLTVTDVNGNSANCNFDVVVSDIIPPTITCPGNQTGNVNASCNFSIPDYSGLATTGDNCAVDTVTQVPAAGTNVSVGTTNIVLTVTDVNGNSANCNFDVVVSDIIPPTITCPGNQTGNVNASCNFSIPDYSGLATTGDNCAVDTVTQVPAAGTNVSVGTTNIVLTVTDVNGNSANCNFDVVVSDIIPPTITCPGNQTGNVNASCNFSIPDYSGLATTGDNCAVDTVTQVPAAGTNVSVGTTNIVLTVTDVNGNSANCNFDVVVSDIIPPTITCPGNQTGNVNASCNFSIPDYSGLATTGDNCAVDTVTQVPAAGTNVSVGTTNIVLTVTDVNGNSANCNFDVVVSDIIPPTITCPGNQTGNVNASCNFSIPDYSGLATTGDNCAVDTVTQVPAAGTNVSVGTTNIVLTVTDVNGNSANCNFDVFVSDIIPPTITCPGNQTGNVNASCNFSIPDYSGLATTGDNCAVDTVTQVPAAGTNVSVGTTNIVLTVTDVNGNSANCNFDVVVSDIIPPTITCPGNQTGNVNASCNFSIPDYSGLATTGDNCAVDTVTQVPAAGTNVSVGTTNIVLTVTDVNGNSANCNFDVVVSDIIPPTITCAANVAVNVDAGQCYATVSLTNPVTSDACGINAASLSNDAPATFPVGTTTVIWTVEDNNGNTSTCTQSVTVLDAQDPTIACPADITVDNDTGVCGATVTYTAPVGTDNCPGATTVLLSGPTSGSVFPIGTTTVTYQVTDASNNVVTCSFDVTVNDTELPEITCPADITVDNDTGVCGATVTYTVPVGTDNCPGFTVTSTHSPGDTFTVGTTVVTYTVTDASNNSVSCSFNVTVNDNENPTASDPATIDVQCIGDVPAPDISVVIDEADNCPGPITVTHISDASDGNFNPEIISRTYSVTDASGNSITVTQLIIVEDSIIPTASNPAALNLQCFADIPPNDSSLVIDEVDNCSIPTVAFLSESDNGGTGSNANPYVLSRLYSVTDASGNYLVVVHTITVSDTIDPVIPLIEDRTDECSVTISAPSTTDNCTGTILGINGDFSFPYTFDEDGTYVITWLFDDGNGNAITIDQTIVIDDVTPPVPDIANLPDINVVDCEVYVDRPTAFDNCVGNINGQTSTSFPITTFGTTVITWTYNDGNGQVVTQTQNVTLTKPAISGGTLTGYVSNLDPLLPPSSDIPITACPDEINPVTIDLSGDIGTIVHWEQFEAGGNNWSIIPGTAGLDQYNIDFDFANTESTIFRVLVQVGTCTEYSTLINVHAIPPDIAPTLDENYLNICLGTEITLIARSGYSEYIDPTEEEAGGFDQGQFPDQWNPLMWLIDGEVAGSSFTAAGNNGEVNNWSGTNNHPVGTLYEIEYDSNDFKFAIAHGNYNSAEYIETFPPGNPTTLETPIFSLIGLEDPVLSFDEAWNLHAGDIATLELSFDGGLTYPVLLDNHMGTSPISSWWDNATESPWPYQLPQPGGATTTHFVFDVDNSTYDLSPWVSYSQVRIKWTFFGTTDESSWAIDEITFPLDGAESTYIEWTEGIGDPGVPALIEGELNVEFTFTPDAPGHHQYGATTLINGCRAYDPEGTAIADVLVNYAYAGEDRAMTGSDCGLKEVELNAYDNTLSALENAAKGAYTLPDNCTNCDDPGTMATGVWTIVSSTSTCGTDGVSFSDPTDPNAIFTADEGTYTLRWTVGPAAPGDATCSDEVVITLGNCDQVDFDGDDDHANFGNNYNLNDVFSIEVWIKPDPQTNSGNANDAVQTIISKRNASNLGENSGFDLRLEGTTLSFNWNTAGSIVSPYPIDTDRWYHIAVTRAKTGKLFKLYIDGIEVNVVSGNPPGANNYECILGGMDQTGTPPNKPVNYFSGWIDEIRIWDKPLNPHHIRQMMNQEIQQNGTKVIGQVIPIDINGPDLDGNGLDDDDELLWSNLVGYYRMDQISCGNLLPYSGTGLNGRLKNITSAEEQTAPLPYTSRVDGQNWVTDNTWTHFNVWDPPNSEGVDGTAIDWNIAQISHDINSGAKDITLLGLISDAIDKRLTIADPVPINNTETNTGQGLWITHYLYLDGIIDLVGESQLVQKRYTSVQFSESILDVNSGGYGLRSQQGTTNLYNYNYWSSPFGPQIMGSNNNDYSVSEILLDGTVSSTPQAIAWTSSYDATGSTNPITLSRRWIYAYENYPNDSGNPWNTYAEWRYLAENGTLAVGLGFTMKGSGVGDPVNDVQNYVFKGKPNNETILTPVTIGNQALVGNPYASSIDADEFIRDNIPGGGGNPGSSSSIDGTLYFWEHYTSNFTHYLEEYEGGYATYNLTGGLGAYAPPLISGNGTSTKTPGRYIPVAQGFFVTALATGGDVTFENDQRTFIREATGVSVFMDAYNSEEANGRATEPTDDAEEDLIKRVRMDAKTPDNLVRPLLLGFVPDNRANDGFNVGYDAENTDEYPSDFSWIIGEKLYTIQGVGEFNVSKRYPLNVRLSTPGDIEISLNSLENFDEDINVYLHDTLLNTYTLLNDQVFHINLFAGDQGKRFFITFETEEDALNVDNNIVDTILVNYLNDSNEIYLGLPNSIEVTEVALINILGQHIMTFDSNEFKTVNSNEIRIPVKSVSEGAYVIKVESNLGSTSKKVIIKY